MTKTQRYQKEYRRKHHAEHIAYMHKYHRTARYRAWDKKRNNAPKRKAQRRAYMKVYCKTEQYKAYDRRRARTPERIAYLRKLGKTDKVRLYTAVRDANRRAKEWGVRGKWTREQFMALCKKFDNVCLRCLKRKTLTPDHVVPFCKGGDNYFSNIQPLCISCNDKKHGATIDYRKTYRQAK